MNIIDNYFVRAKTTHSPLIWYHFYHFETKFGDKLTLTNIYIINRKWNLRLFILKNVVFFILPFLQ